MSKWTIIGLVIVIIAIIAGVAGFSIYRNSGKGAEKNVSNYEAKGGEWKNGQRFFQDVELSDVDKWIDSLGL